MNDITLTLPGQLNPLPNPSTGPSDLGGIISSFINVAFLLAGVLLLIWLIWGALQYILSGGDKEKLAKARSRIISAIIGFIIIALAFSITQFVKDILKPDFSKPAPEVTDRT